MCSALSLADLEVLSADPGGICAVRGLHQLGSVLCWAAQQHLQEVPHGDTIGEASAGLKWRILPGRASRGVVLAEGLSEKTWSQLWSRGGHLGGSCLVHSLSSHAAVAPNTTEP